MKVIARIQPLCLCFFAANSRLSRQHCGQLFEGIVNSAVRGFKLIVRPLHVEQPRLRLQKQTDWLLIGMLSIQLRPLFEVVSPSIPPESIQS